MENALSQLTAGAANEAKPSWPTDPSGISVLYAKCCQNWALLLDKNMPSRMLTELLGSAAADLALAPELANDNLCENIKVLLLRADRVERGCPAISPAAFGSALQIAKLCLMYATTRGYMARLLSDHREEIERGARMYWPVHFENCIALTKRAEQVNRDYADVW